MRNARYKTVAAPRTSSLVLAAFALFAVTLAASIANAKSAPDSFADLAERLLPSVVNISTTQTVEGNKGPELPQLPPGSPFEDFFKDFFDRNAPQQRSRRATSLGSGFIISEDGYVVTNNHVIADADEITVILQDDTRLPAELVGRDPKTDIAVLKVKPEKDLPAVGFGRSETARVGDWVVAIGNPFGLDQTLAQVFCGLGFFCDFTQANNRVFIIVTLDGDRGPRRNLARTMCREHYQLKAVRNLVYTIFYCHAGH